MIKRFHIILIRRKTALLALVCFFVCIGLINIFMNLSSTKDQPLMTQQNTSYVILATNDLGMHCYRSDFSAFMILPPANNIRVQVFLNEGKVAKLINSGIDVSYKIIDNTTSADKINFWEYAKDYGYDIEPNIGITGNGLSGKMKLSEDGNFYEVTAIPITPYNDGSTELNPYQLAVITITDSDSGIELASVDNVVVPVSDEMLCSNCHGTVNTSLDILKAHDRLSKTKLVADLNAGKRYKCSECHKDNILKAPGKPDVLSLSQAMHGFHADKMAQSDTDPECYSCHPGPISKCYRSVMASKGITCVNSECHGDMKHVASTLAEGREAWFQEPNCANCHDGKFSVNTDKLYSSSYLLNHSNPAMNGFILCESCHNSTHAEWKSQNPIDNLLPTSILGYPSYINKCSVCHTGTGVIHEISLE